MDAALSLPRHAAARKLVCWAPGFLLFAVLTGCKHLREQMKPETVYVVAKQTYLRDRVAAVSNRVTVVSNGEPLEVVEHGRRFLRAKTSKGDVGWIEDHMVINQAIYDQFAALEKQHLNDPVVATAVLRDDLYLHVKPGRDTDRFYLLPENQKLQLLTRASVPKPAPPQGFLAPPAKVRKSGANAKASYSQEPTVPMEDWWLVRDNRGQVGWLLARRLDVDVPDEIGGYSEGQKMVGAYVLTKVFDPESSLPDHMVPEYVSVTNAYKDGLPYDFDQVRVFTWNTRKHRYETAYRQRNLEGYLPVTIGVDKMAKGGPFPQFTIVAAAGDETKADPLTGAMRPVQTDTLTYQLESGMVHRVLPPGAFPGSTLQAPASTRSHHHRSRGKSTGG